MYREIVTKAVIGKGKIANTSDIILNLANVPSKLLGCWIINHYYVGSYENGKVFAKGKYDLHVWYGYNNDSDTFIHRDTIEYIDEFNIRLKSGEELSDSSELVCQCVKYPTCSALSLGDDGKVTVKVDKELSLDVIGETKLKVQITNSEDEWVNSDDINSINVNYMNK